MQLSKGDAVAATQARDEYEETEFSFSKEGDAASSLIEAFDDGDVEKVQELVKTQVRLCPLLLLLAAVQRLKAPHVEEGCACCKITLFDSASIL